MVAKRAFCSNKNEHPSVLDVNVEHEEFRVAKQIIPKYV